MYVYGCETTYPQTTPLVRTVPGVKTTTLINRVQYNTLLLVVGRFRRYYFNRTKIVGNNDAR